MIFELCISILDYEYIVFILSLLLNRFSSLCWLSY